MNLCAMPAREVKNAAEPGTTPHVSRKFVVHMGSIRMGDQYDWPAGWRTIAARRIHRRSPEAGDKRFGWLFSFGCRSAGMDDGRSTGRMASPISKPTGVDLSTVDQESTTEDGTHGDEGEKAGG